MSATVKCAFEVRDIPGAGRGMFANALIEVGSCLLTEYAAVEVWSEPQRHTLDGSAPKPPSLIVATALAAERSMVLRSRLLGELCPLGYDFESLWARFERHDTRLDQAAEERAFDAFVFGSVDGQQQYLDAQEEALPDTTRHAALNPSLVELYGSSPPLQSEAAALADSFSCSDDVVRRLSAVVDGIAPECPSLSRRDLVKLALSCMYNAFQLALPFDEDESTAAAAGSAPSTAHAPVARRPGSTGRGLFIATSLLNHSCWPNCAWSPVDPRDAGVDPDGRTRMQLRATRNIAPGEQLTISYIDVTLPPQRRSQSLLQSYRFECSCPRCAAHNARTSLRPADSDEDDDAAVLPTPVPMSCAAVCDSADAALYARSPARIFFDPPATGGPSAGLPSPLGAAAAVRAGNRSDSLADNDSAGAAADLLTQGVWCSTITTVLSSLPCAGSKSLPLCSAPSGSLRASVALSALVTAAPAAQEWARSPAVALATKQLAATGALAVAEAIAAAGAQPESRCAGLMTPQLGSLDGPSGASASASEPCPVFRCGVCGLSLPFAAVYSLLTALETGVAPLRPRAAQLRLAASSQAVAVAAADAASSAVALVRDSGRILATVRALTPPQSWLCARATDAALLAAAAATAVWAHAETSAASAASAADQSNRVADAVALRAAASEHVRRRYAVSQSSAVVALAQAAAWRTLLPRHHPKRVVSALRAAAALAAVAARAAAGDGSTVHPSASHGAFVPLAEAEWAGLLRVQWGDASAEGSGGETLEGSGALAELVRVFHRHQKELVCVAGPVSPQAGDDTDASEASALRLSAAGRLHDMPQCRAWAQSTAPLAPSREPQLSTAVSALTQAIRACPGDTSGPRSLAVHERLQQTARSLPSCAVTAVVMLVAEAAIEYSVCYGSKDDAVNARAFTELVRTSFKVPLASLFGLVALHYLA